MKSIIQDSECPVCYITGRSDCLEKHHVFGGNPGRKLSEKYGLTIYLTADMHRGKDGIHNNRELADRIKAEVQKIAMEHYDWTVDEFRLIFGKSYV